MFGGETANNLYLLHSGVRGVRMAWGTAQEAATLFGLMHAIPSGSQLAEAGLFQIDHSSLPAEWGYLPGDTPPLGASPDGLLLHPRESHAQVRI